MMRTLYAHQMASLAAEHGTPMQRIREVAAEGGYHDAWAVHPNDLQAQVQQLNEEGFTLRIGRDPGRNLILYVTWHPDPAMHEAALSGWPTAEKLT